MFTSTNDLKLINILNLILLHFNYNNSPKFVNIWINSSDTAEGVKITFWIASKDFSNLYQ